MMLGKLRDLLIMTKPKQLALLMITMYGAYFLAAKKPSLVDLGLLTLTGIGAAGGVTALNMYIERDIDSIMERTRSRPLPRGSLTETEALAGIAALILLGALAGAAINKYVAFAALAGFFFDIIGYTELAKRRSEWALFLGSIAGSMPALGGWAAGAGRISLEGILLAGVVFAWQPLHVAFIHYYYEDDYERAGVPTIPGRLGSRYFANLAAASVVSVIALSWAIYAIAGVGLATAAIVTLLGMRALVEISRFREAPSREMARSMIKYASPLVGIVFLLLPVETVIATL